MNKNNLPVGTRVTFYPVDGADYSAEGEIIKRYACGTMYIVRVFSGIGSKDGRGCDWACAPENIISIEPKAGAWGTYGGCAGTDLI